MNYDVASLKKHLEKHLSTEHYEHSLRTAETAVKMAQAFGVDEEKAYIAGLLHDYTKSMGRSELILKSEELGIEVHEVERAYPYLLHAKLAARMVELDLGIADKEIMSAIEHHTFGAPVMTPLDKIIYVADMIEPGRHYKGLDPLRGMALGDLDEVYREAYVHTVEYLVKARKLIHPMTVEVWNGLFLEQSS